MQYFKAITGVSFLITTVILLTGFNGIRKDPGKRLVHWVVQQSSTLQITGKTNLASFGCAIKGYHQKDTITYLETLNTTGSVALKGSLHIPVNDFDCNNKGLTKDLRKTLKSVAHPDVVIDFISLERLPVFSTTVDKMNGSIGVTIAGVKKRFIVEYTIRRMNGSIHLNGSRNFSFAEFNLVPPQKLAGMIKVKDMFLVDFRLVLQPVS